MANIKFGTDGWRAKLDEDFNYDNVNIVVLAIVEYVNKHYSQKDKPTFFIGYDGRENGFEFAKYTASILSKFGKFDVEVSETICPTPVLAYQTKLNKGLGIMFTASHNPPVYQGLKFIPQYGGPATDDITSEIVENINKIRQNGIDIPENAKSENYKLTSFKKAYFEHIEKLINFEKIKTLKTNILIDFLHSATIGYLDELLKKHQIKFEKYNDFFDSNFGGKMPDPKPKYLQELMAKVKNKPNTIGLSNDGDGDRFGVINELGEYVSPNEIMAILLMHLSKNKGYKGALIKTIASSTMLDILAQKLQISLVETKVGFKWLGKAMRENETIIAGEESGGLSIGTHIPEKDGIIANLLVLEAMAYQNKPLHQLQKELNDFIGYTFINDRIDIDLTQHSNNITDEKFIELFKNETTKISKLEGLKIYLDNNLSWILCRKSGTEPLLRVYVETFNEKRLGEIKSLITQNIL